MWVYEYYLTHNNTIPSFVKFITFSLKILALLLHLFTNYNSYLFSGANFNKNTNGITKNVESMPATILSFEKINKMIVICLFNHVQNTNKRPQFNFFNAENL